MVCFYLLVLVKVANLETFSNLKTVALNPNTPGEGGYTDHWYILF